MPRPAHQPTDESREFVKRAAAAGVAQDNIAGCLKIALLTLRKHYGYELAYGIENLREMAMGCLIRSAKKGNFQAALAILRRGETGSWREKIDLTNRNLGEFEGLSDEELSAKIAEIRGEMPDADRTEH